VWSAEERAEGLEYMHPKASSHSGRIVGNPYLGLLQDCLSTKGDSGVIRSPAMAPDLLELQDFAARYTAAWCSRNPASVAAFFSQDGALRVNDDPPAVGWAAVTQVAHSFMTAFPDLRVVMDDLLMRGDTAEYHWTLTGTNAGTGHRVRISGFEQWRLGPDGLIASSQGHFDAAEYQRQLEKGVSPENRSAAEATDGMRCQVIQIVEKYIDAVRRNDASALPLHPDAVCEFPTNTYRGAASFRQGLDQFARILKSIDVIRLVVDGEHCVAIVNIDTVFGPIPFAEHIHVANGEIVSIRGYCDPRPMLTGTNTPA
jgi:ketosteroid isomerase-like protein